MEETKPGERPPQTRRGQINNQVCRGRRVERKILEDNSWKEQ